MKGLGMLCLAGLTAWATADTVRVALFMPITDGSENAVSCGEGKTLKDGTCYWTGGGEWALTMTALKAVEEFNLRSSAFVPQFAQLGTCNITMEVKVYDSGSAPTISIRNLLSAIQEPEPPHAVIGMDTSDASIPSAIISGALDIPQLSYWATSPALDSVENYPRFMRTIPSDEAVALAICRYWIAQGYEYASMIYVNDEYGEAYKDAVLYHCMSLGMKQVYVFPFINSESQIKQQVEAMKETGVKVFLVVSLNDGFATIMKEAESQGILGKGTSWMLADGVPSSVLNALEGDVRKGASGSLRVLSAGGTPGTARWEAFRSAWPTFNVQTMNQYLPSEWKAPSNLFTTFPANGLEVKDVGTFAFDAVAAIGIAACRQGVQESQGKSFGTKFWDSKEELSFDGISGRVEFDEKGNRRVSTASAQLTNVLLPEGSYSEVYLGVYSTETGKWESEKALLNGDSEEAILDFVPPEHDMNLPGNLKLFSVALFGINFVLAASFTLWTYLNRHHVVVKVSQTKFLAFISLGAMISSSAILPLTVDDQDAPADLYNYTTPIALDGDYMLANAACKLSVWLYSIGFTITYSSLASKIWRIKKIFNNKKMKKVIITNRQLFTIMGVCMLIDTVLIAAWQVTGPLEFEREVVASDRYGNPLESIGRCVSENAALFLSLVGAFHLSLLVMGNVFAYQGRHINTAFNEGKYVAVAMVSNLQVLALAIPLLILVADNPSSTMFLRSGVLFLNDLSVLLLVFVPKIIAVNSGKTMDSFLQTSSDNNSSNRATGGEYSKGGHSYVMSSVVETRDDII